MLHDAEVDEVLRELDLKDDDDLLNMTCLKNDDMSGLDLTSILDRKADDLSITTILKEDEDNWGLKATKTRKEEVMEDNALAEKIRKQRISIERATIRLKAFCKEIRSVLQKIPEK